MKLAKIHLFTVVITVDGRKLICDLFSLSKSRVLLSNIDKSKLELNKNFEIRSTSNYLKGKH